MTGGNTSGFKSFKDSYHHFAMGIAEIAADGTFVITKQPNSNGFNGMVTDVTVRSQILYEIQGNVSHECERSKHKVVQCAGKGRKRESRWRAETGRRSTAALTPDLPQPRRAGHPGRHHGDKRGAGPRRGHGRAGRRAAVDDQSRHLRCCGVPGGDDVLCDRAGCDGWVLPSKSALIPAEKFDTIRLQIKKNLGDKVLSQFTTFDITQYGVAKENPENEALGTAMLYIFAQAKNKEAFGPVGSLTALVHREGLGHYPGMHTFMDSRSEWGERRLSAARPRGQREWQSCCKPALPDLARGSTAGDAQR